VKRCVNSISHANGKKIRVLTVSLAGELTPWWRSDWLARYRLSIVRIDFVDGITRLNLALTLSSRYLDILTVAGGIFVTTRALNPRYT